MREHRLTFGSNGFHTPLSVRFQPVGKRFFVFAATKDSRLSLVLTCAARDEYDASYLRQLEEEAVALATAVREQLHLLVLEFGGACEPGEVVFEDVFHPPSVEGTSLRVFPRAGGVRIGVGQARLMVHFTPEHLRELERRLAAGVVMGPAHRFFLDAEHLEEPVAKLIVLWSGLAILFKTEDHTAIDEKLRARFPWISSSETTGRSHRAVVKSSIRRVRDELAHLGEKDPTGLERVREAARRECENLRRAYVSLLLIEEPK